MKRQNVLWMNIINRTKIKIMALFFAPTGISFLLINNIVQFLKI